MKVFCPLKITEQALQEGEFEHSFDEKSSSTWEENMTIPHG